MQIQVLGPLSAEVAGRSIVPSAAKPRQMLTLLALRRSSLVSQNALIDELWGSKVPASASTTVQTYVMKLRKLLDAAGGAGTGKRVLVTRSSGYSFECDELDWHIDVVSFRRTCDTADAAYANRDFMRAAAQYADALGVWRGNAFQDVPKGSVLDIEAVHLETERLYAIERKINAEIMTNNLSTAILDLKGLLREHPLNENFCALYMLSMYRAGCAAEAIGYFHTLRKRLSDTLGIDPGPVCQGLFQGMLERRADLMLPDHHKLCGSTLLAS